MAKRIVIASLLVSLGLPVAVRAAFPLESMAPDRLGLQYGFSFRGQDITDRDIPSHEILHAFLLGYAPLPYLAVEAGLGVDRFSVDRYDNVRFEGDYGLAPQGGIVLASPSLFGLVRLQGGGRLLFLDSEDGRGYAYSGFIYSPFLSANILPSGFVSVELGARGHTIDGSMEGPDGRGQAFSNRETVRGFLSLTMKSPRESAFLTLDADFSPSIHSDWSRGPSEASLGVSFGTVLGGKRKASAAPKAPPYFPAYTDMKERQKQMAKELE